MAKAKHTIRIISGSHRSRRLPVLDYSGLRPTGDRLRGVLFNWLQMHLAGKKVLDLCAGSGALGFEASSRGASHVELVESNRRIYNQLHQVKEDFNFQNTVVINQTAQKFLSQSHDKYDVVFLDPPFSDNLLEELTLLTLPHVTTNGFLYRESAMDQELLKLPNNWQLYRQKNAGQVKIELWRKLKSNLEE
ncbi:MAG: 16S rRNA (guanine(966)-N(2))-methyltransferase RsmD [Marinicellaceae bacterium]